jgi:hypothetical protein
MKDPEKNFQILEFGNYWMDIGTIYQLYFHWDSPGVTQGLLKTLFFYQELPLGLFSFILPKTPPNRKNQSW